VHRTRLERKRRQRGEIGRDTKETQSTMHNEKQVDEKLWELLLGWARQNNINASTWLDLLAEHDATDLASLQEITCTPKLWLRLLPRVEGKLILCERLTQWRETVQVKKTDFGALCFKHKKHDLNIRELSYECNVEVANLALTGVQEFCRKKVGDFSMALIQKGVPFWICGCWEEVWTDLLEATGWRQVEKVELADSRKRRFNIERPALFKAVWGAEDVYVLRVPPGRDIVRMYGQAFRGYLLTQQLSDAHVRAFYVPELTESIPVYRDLNNMGALKECVYDAIVVIGAVKELSDFLGKRDAVREVEVKKLATWATFKPWGWEVWTRGPVKVVLVGCERSYWGNMAEIMADEFFKMGARELIHFGVKVGTLVDANAERENVFCPRKFVLVNEEQHEVIEIDNSLGHHLWHLRCAAHASIPTPLDETLSIVRDAKKDLGIMSIDDEAAYMARAAYNFNGRSARKVRFGAIFFASDYLRGAHEHSSFAASLGAKKNPDQQRAETALIAHACGHFYCSVLNLVVYLCHNCGAKEMKLETQSDAPRLRGGTQ
jgi:hypothetical protein